MAIDVDVVLEQLRTALLYYRANIRSGPVARLRKLTLKLDESIFFVIKLYLIKIMIINVFNFKWLRCSPPSNGHTGARRGAPALGASAIPPLTGDPDVDADIKAFMEARDKIRHSEYILQLSALYRKCLVLCQVVIRELWWRHV